MSDLTQATKDSITELVLREFASRSDADKKLLVAAALFYAEEHGPCIPPAQTLLIMCRLAEPVWIEKHGADIDAKYGIPPSRPTVERAMLSMDDVEKR